MAAVRSAPLFVGSITLGPGEQTIYTSPPGVITLVKSFYLYNSSGEVLAWNLQHVALSGSRAILAIDSALAAAAFVTPEVWAVLDPADELQVYSDQAGTSAVVGCYGAQLTG
jgi:hypothetical protein